MTQRAALGFRAHSGWAAVVALCGPPESPKVILRRRLELADHTIAGSMQPYHAAEGMRLKDAEAYLHRCTKATRILAHTAVQDLVSTIAEEGFSLTGARLLLGSGRPVGDLAATLASHPLIHTAEGEFYRDAIRQACAARGVPLVGMPEKGLVTTRAAELGKTIGPPWRADEKLCATAAWLELSNPQT